MKNNKISARNNNAPDVLFSTRPPVALTCSNCWKEQRAERNICYGCGARFVFMDEVPKKQKPVPAMQKQAR